MRRGAHDCRDHPLHQSRRAAHQEDFPSATGTIVSDGSACLMVQGTAERVQVENVDALAALIGALKSNQAITLRALHGDLPAKVEVTTAAKLNGDPRKDMIARTGRHLVYRGPAFALIDYDSKGMPTMSPID